MTDKKRLVAVSNRLPISLEREGDGWVVHPGSGGLVTAMAPVLRNRGGVWVGWPGTREDLHLRELVAAASRTAGYTLVPVMLTADEVDNYYDGFSNQIAWPLFHDLQTRCNFSPAFWHYYLEVNRKFAEHVAVYSTEQDYVWVHDYHLICVGRALQEMKVRRDTGFFLHTPFPPLDIFVKLPWRSQVLLHLLAYDLVGFQTLNDRRNFIECLQRFVPGVRVQGRGAVVSVAHQGRTVRVGTFPISIDYGDFIRTARDPEVESRYHRLREMFHGQKIMLGVDRMDYTKGLDQRLEGYRNALERYSDLRGKITLIQVLVPSRRTLREYKILKARIDRLIGEINGQFSTAGWAPIHYHYRNLGKKELVAKYRAADIALVTPLKDGMNLVAKEYCACTIGNEGVLILSEFAGAAAQFQRQALLVNPYDTEGMADAIHRAFVMERPEKRARMRRLREIIRRQDIYRWVDSFLQAAFARHLVDFKVQEFVHEVAREDATRSL